MKCFTERVVLMGVTALILSCVANHAGQTASAPAGDTAAASGTNLCPLVFENDATADNLSGPQNDSRNDHPFTVRSVAGVQPFGRPQPTRDEAASNNVAFLDNTASATALMGVKIVSADPGANREPTLNYLAPRRRAFPDPVRPLSLDQPAIPSTSSVNANGQMIFRMIGPGVPTVAEFDDQTQQIEGMSTRAWTTIAGWHPGESAFPNGRDPGAHSDLISFAF